jgi:FixJ family two-component response regulator
MLMPEGISESTPDPAADIVLVDDDHSFLRAMTRQLMALGFCVEAFEKPQAAFRYLESGSGRCLIVDLHMPDMSGLELQGALENVGRPLAVIFLSGQGDIQSTVQAMRGGAVDFLEKPVEAHALLKAIEKALEQHETDVQESALFQQSKDRLARLTSRQRSVFDIVITGASNKEIALNLGISERTVKAHRHDIMDRLEAQSVPDLVNLANHLDLSSDTG